MLKKKQNIVSTSYSQVKNEKIECKNNNNIFQLYILDKIK